VPDPVCEPAQVEERHREKAREFCEQLAGDPCPRCERLALAFAEQEREVLEREAAAVEKLAAKTKAVFGRRDGVLEAYRDVVSMLRAAALRATPGGEREGE
jgi:hypothetical protein